MRLVACNELAEMRAQLVVGIDRDVMELIHGDQPVVKGFHSELVHGEAEGGMGAHQHLVPAVEKRLDGLDLAALGAWRVAEIPLRRNGPVGPEAELTQLSHH